ncbi:MAG: oligosaccharide flippase family protein [Woeseiaceae bacterium]
MRSFLARHSEFVSNVAIIMSGRTLAAMIALFTMPIVARLFVPSDFGVAAIFVSIASILSTLASLRYEAAVVLPKENAEAVTLVALAYRIAFSIAASFMILIGIYELSGLNWPTLELLGYWMWLVPLCVLLLAGLHIQESWLTRTKHFKLISGSLVAGNSITAGSRIGFGAFFGSSILGLITGYLIGLISRLAIQHKASREGLKAALQRMGWPAMKDTAQRYSDFPKLNAPAGLVFSTGQNLPVLLFGTMFSPSVAGLYAMANRLAQVPVAIVANSMRRVFLQKAATIIHDGRSLNRAFLLATGGLALLGILPILCLWFFGQELSTWLLGSRWTDAGRYLEIMAPWLFMLWIESPCNPVFVVLRKQKFWLSLQTVLTLLRLAAFGLAILMGSSPEWTLQAFVIASVAGNILTILTALALISRQPIESRQS